MHGRRPVARGHPVLAMGRYCASQNLSGSSLTLSGPVKGSERPEGSECHC
jgi:hypothetical protein